MKNNQNRLVSDLLLLGVDEKNYTSNSALSLLYSIRMYAKFVNDYEIINESDKLLSQHSSEVKYISQEHDKFLPMKYLPKRKRG